MRINRLKAIQILAFVIIGLVIITFYWPVSAQGENLLVNPGFEGEYSGYVPETAAEVADCPHNICNTAQTPLGWKPWWVKERPTDVNPEFKPATTNVSGNRVRNGTRAAQYFSFWSTHKAGLRQTVTVPPNSSLQFSVFGHSWLTEADNSLVSDRSGTPNMQIGIDPTGGANPYSPAVVWSGYQQAYDVYQQFTVQAQAQGDKVTVFLFSAPSVNPNSPDYGFKHTDIYWDDASLTVIGASAAPPAQPPASSSGTGTGNTSSSSAPAAVSPFVPGPTPTPDAEGVIYVEVQPGDSIWAIAARAGLTIDQFIDLNSITRDAVVRAGDRMIIGHGDPSGQEPTPEAQGGSTDTAGTEGSGEGAEVVEATPTPEAIAEAETAPGASLCLKAYDDANKNGVHDSSESLREAVAFTVSDGESVVSNYVTDGVSEPFCIQGLGAGSFRITRSSLPNEIMTTPGDHSISMTDGSMLSLEFGSYLSDDILVEADTSAENTSGENAADPAAADAGGGLNGITIAAIVVGALLIIGVIAYIVSSRRSSA